MELRKRAEAGEITLAYLDEAGFEQTPPNRGAWTPVGEQHCIEAGRGPRLNIVAALLSDGKVISARLWRTMTSELFVGFLGLLREQAATTAKPMTIILDNPSPHRQQTDPGHPFDSRVNMGSPAVYGSGTIVPMKCRWASS